MSAYKFLRLTLGVAALSAAIAASATTTAPANTGSVDGFGNDINWTLSIDGGSSQPVGLAPYGGYYNGAPFTGASAWIGLLGVPTSTYTYTTTFNVDAGDLAGYGVSGAFSSDNASKLFLNGSDTGIGAAYGNGGAVPGDSYLQAFTFSLNSGFVAGLNTMSFVVTNDAGSVSGGWANPDPNGLRAEMQAVPEPCSMAVLGLGILGVIRRRRNA